MGHIAGLLWRPTSQQHAMKVAQSVVIILLFVGGGCREEPPKPIRGDAMSGKHVAKYFLVSLHDNDISSMDIYAIEEPSAVDKVGRWIEEHVNSSGTVQKARGLVLLRWHNELSRFDEYGHIISSDFVSDSDVVSPRDLTTLKKLFRDCGKRVDTVPGRKRPRKSDNPDEQAVIEKDDGEHSPSNSIAPHAPDHPNKRPEPPNNGGPDK
jgi:hypothetical protein